MLRILYLTCSILLMLEGVLLSLLQYLSFSRLSGDALAATGLGLVVVVASVANMANSWASGARDLRRLALTVNLLAIPYLTLWCLTSGVGTTWMLLSGLLGTGVIACGFLLRPPQEPRGPGGQETRETRGSGLKDKG